MFHEDMAGLLRGLPHTNGSGDDISNAGQRLITVVGSDSPKTGTQTGGSIGAPLGGVKKSSRDMIEINTLSGEGTSAANQADRDMIVTPAQTLPLETAEASDLQEIGSTQRRYTANAPTQKRKLGELDLNETEAAIELSGPIQKRPRLHCDFWCAEPGCSRTMKQINRMKEHMNGGHEGQKVTLPRYWRDASGEWQKSERWELQINALMERQKKGFTKAAFEIEKKQVEEQASRSPHRSNILTPDSGQPTPPGLTSWPVNSAGVHDQIAYLHANPGLQHPAPEMTRRSSGDPRLGSQSSMHYGDGPNSYLAIGTTHAANHGSPTHQEYITTMTSQYHNPLYPSNSYTRK